MHRLTKIMFVVGFLLTSVWSYSSNSMYAQNQKFTFEFKQASIGTIFQYIEKNSEFIFMYRTDLLDTSKKVSVTVNGQTVSQILDQVLKGMPVTYEIDDRQIVLKKIEEQSKVVPQQSGQKKMIQGFVKDEKGEAIIGATIKVKDTEIGTATNMDGLYNLTVPSENSVLVVSYIGYVSQEVTVGKRQNIIVTLKEDAKSLEEVVVTAYGTGQKKASMVGSVEQIKPGELQVPSSSLSSAFAGRMAGVIAVQRSGEPGADGANFWIRGKSTFNSSATGALIVLDGVEISSTQLNRLDPEAIESFSILKDATATALYGTRGANGVMIVTTKSGKNLDRPIINVRIEGSVNQMGKTPQMVDGPTYMKLYNEAISRPGESGILYTPEQIVATQAGTNPYLYPNVNWYDELFNKLSFAERINFNIRGGSQRMDYFMSASFRHSNGNMKSLSKDYFSYDNNIRNINYEFINNLNLYATPSTKVSLGLNLSVIDRSGPGMSANDVFGLTRRVNPVEFPVKFQPGTSDFRGVLWGDDGEFVDGYGNPVAEYVTSYQESLSSIITANFKVEQKLDMLLKGLKVSGLFSFKNYTTNGTKRNANYNRYEVATFDPATMEYALKRVGNEKSTELKSEFPKGGDRKTYLQAMIDYNHTFNVVHDLNVMFIYNQEQYNTNTPDQLFNSLPKRKQGVAGRLSYAYDGRYLAEANFGYNGSENFAKGHRFGFFPSIAVGYNISQEKFWAPLKDYISKLKLRASWGLVGNDQIGGTRFIYLEEMELGKSNDYATGATGNISKKGPKWTKFYNPNLTWEVGEKINIGMDMQLLDALNLTFDVFKEKRRDIFMDSSATTPLFLGLEGAKTYGNFGKMENQGFEMAADFNKQINKDLFVSFKGTFTYAHNTITEKNEPDFQEYPNLSEVGHSYGVGLGLVAQGLYPNQAAVDGSPAVKFGYPTTLPGDIWYVNQPNRWGHYDNVIDQNDRVRMGYPTEPEIVYGFGPSIKYKNWDFSFFFQGVARTSLWMSGFHPFGTNSVRGVPEFVAASHWSEENPDINAKYPRLTRLSNSNNEQASSFWLRNGAFLKLKNAEIGYTLKKNIRFYLSGLNLLTFSPFKEWDPEMGGGSGLKYPTQRVFNVGFQITFNNK